MKYVLVIFTLINSTFEVEPITEYANLDACERGKQTIIDDFHDQPLGDIQAKDLKIICVPKT